MPIRTDREKQIIFIASATGVHFLMSIGLFLAKFSAAMDRFDTLEAASLADRGLTFASDLLFWPLYYPLTHWTPKPLLNSLLPGMLGYIPMLLNSMIWGVAIWIIMRWKQNKKVTA